MTTVDIILICYKQEQYIEQALRSIYAQELPKDVTARILVADDASPDKTLAIIKRLAAESPYSIFFLPEAPNMGISRNYQRSFSATNADYVFVIEGDDYWDRANHIGQHVLFLEKHPEISMSMNRFYQTTLDGSSKTLPGWPRDKEYIEISLEKQISQGNQLGNLSACCFRSSLLHQLPSDMYTIHVDDFLLGIMMAEYGNIAVLKEPTSVYRCNPNSMWARLSLIGKYRRNMQFARMYDAYQQKRYHGMWLAYRKHMLRDLYKKIRTEIAHTLKRIFK